MRQEDPFFGSLPFGEALHANSLNRVSPLERAPFAVIGLNQNIPSNAIVSLWKGETSGAPGPAGAPVRPLPDGEITMTIGGTGANAADDTVGGPGAEQVKINFLREDGTEDFFVADMDGANRVTIPTPIWRVQPGTGVVGGLAGERRRNNSVITISALSDDEVFDVIPLDTLGGGYGATRSGAFTVATGFTAYLKAVFFGTDDNMETFFSIDVPGVGLRTTMALLNDHGQLEIRGCVPALADFAFLAKSVSGNATMTATLGVFPVTSISGECPRTFLPLLPSQL